MKDLGAAEGGETMGGSSRGELSSSGRSTEMINDGRSDADRQVLIKGVGKHLLPTAQACRLRRPGPAVAAPDTGNRHIDLFCDLGPAQVLIAKLQDPIRGGAVCGRP
jgi:hypothetical protein